MGLTGKERHWIQLCSDLHLLFCDCQDPIAHLTRCLMVLTEEEASTVEGIRTMGVDTDGDTAGGPGDTATTPGGTADLATDG
ncbi:ORF2 [torque teno Delphinidae virus 44]